jgi:archaellum component FlaF (FlaF/FlaG flagellin family)
MPDAMVIALLVNFVAFTLLYVALTAARVQVAKAEEARAAEMVTAGDAVTPPRLSEVEDV